MATMTATTTDRSGPRAIGARPQSFRNNAGPVRPTAPESEHYRSLINAERAKLDEYQAQMAALSAELRGHYGKREEADRERREILAEISELNLKIEKLDKQRLELQKSLVSAQDQSRALRTQIENLQRDLPYQTVEEIDRKLEELEQTRLDGNITLKQEKELASQRNKLKAYRVEVLRAEQLQKELLEQAETSGAETTDAMRAATEQVNTVRDNIRQLRDARSNLRDKLTTLRAAQDEKIEPVRQITSQMEKISAAMAESNTKINQWRTEMREKESEFLAEQAKQRQSRAELDRYTRQLRQVQEDKKSLTAQLGVTAETKLSWKSTLALQLKSYLEDIEGRNQKHSSQGLPISAGTRSTEAEDFEEKKDGDVVDTAIGQFVIVRNTKHTEESTGTLCGKAAKHQKKSAGKKPAAGYSAISGTGASLSPTGVLSHALPVVQDFAKIGIPCPTRISDCKAVIESLREIVEAEEKKNATFVNLAELKRKNLTERIAQLEAAEAELLANPPESWKKPKEQKPVGTVADGDAK